MNWISVGNRVINLDQLVSFRVGTEYANGQTQIVLYQTLGAPGEPAQHITLTGDAADEFLWKFNAITSVYVASQVQNAQAR